VLGKRDTIIAHDAIEMTVMQDTVWRLHNGEIPSVSVAATTT
jgi:hypothetical protein